MRGIEMKKSFWRWRLTPEKLSETDPPENSGGGGKKQPALPDDDNEIEKAESVRPNRNHSWMISSTDI